MITAFSKRSLKKKLMAIILLTSGVVLFITFTAFMINDVASFRRSIAEELISLAGIISNNSSAAIMTDDPKEVQETLEGLTANPRVLSVRIFTSEGRLFAKYLAPGAERSRLRTSTGEEWSMAASVKTLSSGKSARAGVIRGAGRDFRIVKSILFDGRHIGTVVIQPNMRGLTDKLYLSFTLAALVLLASSLIAYLMSTKLQRLISTPITDLAHTMRNVSREKNYSLRAAKTSEDEIGDLIDGFNTMLTEIEDRDEILRQRQDHLQKLAHFDNLTHLPNRALYCDRLLQAMLQAERKNQKVAVMFIDLDHFKDINDNYGHRTGDLLLKDVAARLQRILRASDTVARMGGDEFTLLMTDVETTDDVAAVGRKIVKNLSQPYQVEGKEIFISASVGITFFPDDGLTVEELLKNADTAMYQAKSNGKSMAKFYSQDMQIRTKERLLMLNSLHYAIEQHELVLHYLPKINIEKGSMVGMEALLRWQHPELGLVSPEKFIPLAEENGMIVQIGEWVLRSVCLQVRGWQKQGYSPLPVAVNVSPVQFKRYNFAETVKGILEETGVDSSLLELELTESAIMLDMDSTITALESFKTLGVRISIDDFGTGYSSLNQLKRFPIDAVKIDRSFTNKLTTSTDDRAIVTAIICMAQSLGLNIIAEGVETEAQRSLLSQQGCNEMQGFLFSKPVPPELLEKFMHKEEAALKSGLCG